MEDEAEEAILSGTDELNHLINTTRTTTATTTTTTTTTITDVDEALEQCGPFGRFQFLMQVFFMFIVFGSAYQSVCSYFIGADIPWTCVHANTSAFCRENFGVDITSLSVNFSQRCKMERSAWRYSQPRTSSYVSQFDLVCEKESVNAIVGASFFIGSAIAVLPCSAIADIYGRKLVLSGSCFVCLLSSVGCSFVTAVWQLVFLRAVIGAAEGQICNVAYVYLVEFMPASKRAASLNVFQIAFVLCGYFLVGVAYLERDWRRLDLYLSFPILLPLLLFVFVPESPRWLLACGRRAEAERIVQRISIINRKPLYNIEFAQTTPTTNDHQNTRKKYTYLDLFRNCKVCVLVLALSFCWYSVALLFFGVTFEAQNLGSNIYESFSVITTPDMPCCLLALLLCKFCGRRKVISISFLLGGIFIGGIAIFVENAAVGWTSIVLAICGKVFLNIIYNVMFLWTFELFPTVIRGQGSGICLLLSRFGAATAPFLSDVLQNVDPRLSYVFMGVMSLLSCIAALLLNETKGLPLREQYNDFFTTTTTLVIENDLDNVIENELVDDE